MISAYPAEGRSPAGGIQNAVVNLMSGFIESRSEISITIIAPSRDVRTLSRTPQLWGTLIHIPIGGGVRNWRSVLHREVPGLARAISADVVHVQGVASVAARFPHCLLTVHGFSERDVWHGPRSLAQRVPRTMAVAALEGFPRAVARNVIDVSDVGRFHAPWQRRWRIPNAIDRRYFEAARREGRGDPSHFVALGGVSPIKNTLGIIRAFATAERLVGGIRLTIAGPIVDSEYAAACRRELIGAGMVERIDLVGTLNQDEVRALLVGAGTLLHPSVQENAPVAVSEALASGCAIVASRAGGIPGMVRGLANCHLVDPHSSADIARGIVAASAPEDPTSAKARIESARRYAPLAVATETEKLYRLLAGERSGSPRPE